MKLEERSAQLWAILVLSARNRQVLTYGLVAKAIGAPAAALGGWLDPIQKYCIENNLPPLTVIVVGEETGLPGSGFHAAAAIPAAQAAVFAFDWLGMTPPRAEDFVEVVARSKRQSSSSKSESALAPGVAAVSRTPEISDRIRVSLMAYSSNSSFSVLPVDVLSAEDLRAELEKLGAVRFARHTSNPFERRSDGPFRPIAELNDVDLQWLATPDSLNHREILYDTKDPARSTKNEPR